MYDGWDLTITWCVIAVLQELRAGLLLLESYLYKQVRSSSKMEQFGETVNFKVLLCQMKKWLAK